MLPFPASLGESCSASPWCHTGCQGAPVLLGRLLGRLRPWSRCRLDLCSQLMAVPLGSLRQQQGPGEESGLSTQHSVLVSLSQAQLHATAQQAPPGQSTQLGGRAAGRGQRGQAVAPDSLQEALGTFLPLSCFAAFTAAKSCSWFPEQRAATPGSNSSL